MASNERPEHLRYVHRGGIELTFSTIDGRVASLPRIRPGEWATWLGCFRDEPQKNDIWSTPSSVLVAFPVHAVRDALVKNPQALLAVIDLIGDRTRTLVQWTLSANVAAPEQRLARMILAVMTGTGDQGGPSQVRMTQEHLGNLGLGSRQRVARLLRKLVQRKLIQAHYGVIYVPSRRKLRKFAAQ